MAREQKCACLTAIEVTWTESWESREGFEFYWVPSMQRMRLEDGREDGVKQEKVPQRRQAKNGQ
ncbi:hypothetical protein FRX31_008942, partial [Thalictrum thalictroides]